MIECVQYLTEISKELLAIRNEFNHIEIDVAILKTQMSELMWWFKAVMLVSVGFVITQIWQLLIMRKK